MKIINLGEQNSLLNTVRRAIAFRAAHEELQAGEEMRVLFAEKGKYPFVFARGKFVAAVNPSGSAAQAPVSEGRYKSVFFVNAEARIDGEKCTVPPVSLTVFEKE